MIPQLWELLSQTLAALETLQPNTYYGITSYPPNWEEQGYFYLAGVEIPSPQYLNNPSFVVQTIPAGSYARFIHKGRLKALPLTLDYIYHTWLPKSGKSLACPLEIVCYGQDFRSPETEESEKEIYVPIE